MITGDSGCIGLRHGWWALLAAAAIAAGACRSITDVALPATAEQLTPPEVYARWWAMTESCSGASGSYPAVTWFVVPDAKTIQLDGKDVAAYWSQGSNRIVLTGHSVLDGGVVRHEMLHALLRAGGHPRDQFLGKCAGVVECPGRCIEDAGPPPAADPAAVTVTADALVVSAVPGPVAPMHTYLGDVYSVTVTVRNPASHPVAVVFSFSAGSPLADGFLYEIRGPSGGVTGGVALADPSRWTFAAGETKWQVFDFASVDELGAQRYPPGDYSVRGAYGGQWSAVAPFTVAP